MPLPVELQIQATPAPLRFSLAAGTVTIIAGANGVGKSALLFQMYRSLGAGNSAYYPGHRQIIFSNSWDSLQQDIETLTKNLYAHPNAFSRYKGAWSEDQFKAVVRKLQNMETQYNRNIVGAIKRDDDIVVRKAKGQESPIDQLNAVFQAAGLVVSLTIDSLGLLVRRGNSTYRIDQMSDGERAAFFLAGAIITQDRDSTILIDEPERHLHPSISGPLVQASIRTRADLAFVFSTHDLNFIEYMSHANLVHVVDSTVTGKDPEMRVFSANFVNGRDTLPDDLRIDILGVRRNVLFVEGVKSSFDRELYSRIYEDWKVIPKGGWEKCVEAVRALSADAALHWISARALIDLDGKSKEEMVSLASSGIHTLPCPTLENLLIMEDVLRAVGQTLAAVSGPSEEDRLDEVKSHIGVLLNAHIDEMVARQTVWQVSRMQTERKISIQEVRSGSAVVAHIDVNDVKAGVRSRIDSILRDNDPLRAVFMLPIKNSPIPNRLAELVGASSFKEYAEIVLRQLDVKSEAGERIRYSLRSALPVISA